MNSPDPQLMQRFHTEDVYKQKLAGGLPLGLAFLATLPAQSTQGPVDEMVHLASVAGRAFAYVDLDSIDFDKEAGIFSTLAGGSLGKALGSIGTGLKSGVGNLASRAAGGVVRASDKVFNPMLAAGGKVKSTIQSAATTLAKPPPVPKLRQAAGNLRQNVGQKLEGFGQNVGKKLESWGSGVKPTAPAAPKVSTQPATYRAPAPPAQGPGAAKVTNAPGAQSWVGGNKPPAPPAPAKAAPKPTGNAGTAPAPKPDAPTEPTGGQTQAPQPLPQAQPAATNSSAPAAPPNQDAFGKFWDRTGLSNGRWQKKVPLLMGGAALAYGAYKGTQALAGEMNKEPKPYQYGGGAQPAYGTNEWGAPDRSMPFSA